MSVQWEPNECRSCQCCQKRYHRMFVGGFALSGLLGSGRASMLPVKTLSLGLWVIVVDLAFMVSHRSIKNFGIWIYQLDHLPAVMSTSFFLIFSEHPYDKLRANLLYLQFLANNWVYSSHTDIKLCTCCLYRHTTVLCHEIFFDQSTLVLWFPYSSHTSHHLSWLPSFLESLMPPKTDARFMQAVWSIPYVSVAFFPD